ncbi:MAG: hypothetical protein JXA68_07630 [Ignavibacteriales bacterium]|nr:hypothetical protein [Ignavibacteriales bacterium]
MKNNQGMSIIVKTVTRVSVWLMVLYAWYIILHGHLTPGGGFGGGVIFAIAMLNVLLAYGSEFTEKWLKIRLLHDIEAASILLFLIVGILGISVLGGFLTNFILKGKLYELISAGTIPIFNILIGIKVAMSLFLAVLILAKTNIENGGEV